MAAAASVITAAATSSATAQFARQFSLTVPP